MAQLARWCFTLNNPTPQEVQSLRELGNGNRVKYLIFGREVGEEGTLHLQGFAIFQRSLRFTAAKTLLGGRCHIEGARGNNHQASEYCKKDGDFEQFGTVPADQGKRVDIEQFKQWVMEQPNKPTRGTIANEFPGLFLKYGRLMEWVDLIYPQPAFVGGPLRTWQRQLGERLDEPADDRRIQFIVDPIGGCGKSWFVRYWFSTHPNETQRLSIGKRDDLAYAIDESKLYFFFDVPRSQSEFLQYSILESLKDRMVFSPKYFSVTKILHHTPHVVVFMNEEPDREKLSRDRYYVTHIRNLYTI